MRSLRLSPRSTSAGHSRDVHRWIHDPVRRWLNLTEKVAQTCASSTTLIQSRRCFPTWPFTFERIEGLWTQRSHEEADPHPVGTSDDQEIRNESGGHYDAQCRFSSA